MEYNRIPISLKSKSNSISVSPYVKNTSITYNSSSSKNENNNINNNMKLISSINYEEENDNNYKYNILLKEKNTIIKKLQNQIKTLLYKDEEKDKKIKMQKHIIDCLKETNKKLQEELNKKNFIIQQNQNIEKKIFHLQKEYLEESNNNSANNFIYIQSLKEQMNKLNEKEQEINNYKKRITFLKLNLKEKENELIKKNNLLNQYMVYNRNKSGSVFNSNNSNQKYDRISISTGKRPKSVKNYNSSEINNNNFKLKAELNQFNIRTNNPSLELNENIFYKNRHNNVNNTNNNSYNKLLENYKDIKTKCNYYYKLAHHLKSKNNKLNEDIKKLMKDINLLNNSNINLKRILSKNKIEQEKANKAKSKNIKTNKNNTHLLLNTNNNNDIYFNEIDRLSNSNNNKNILNRRISNVNNIKVKTSIELISDDEKEKYEYNENNDLINNNGMSEYNKATKKLYEALEQYRELYNQKEKELNNLKIQLKEKEQIIESQNNLQDKITEYLSIIDELETTNNNNKLIINNLNNINNKYEEKIKKLENDISEGEKMKEKLSNKIEKLNTDIKERDSKINKLVSDLKDKEILIKEEQINSLIKMNSKEIPKEDDNKKINELQSFITQMKKELSENKEEINKISEENNFLKQNKKLLEEKIEKIKEEREEKNEQLEDLVKMLNDQEIQYKGIKCDNQELIQGAKQYMNNLKQKEKKINQLVTQNENLKKNIQLFNEEKNKLIANYNLLIKESKESKDNIEYLQSILIQKTELIDKIQKSNDELTLGLNDKKEELKQKKIELNQFEIQYNKLKQEKNFSNEIINLIEENNKIMIENKTLQNKINQLSNENNTYNLQINEINIKYQEQKKLIQEKEKELTYMKEASKAILEKHKKIAEEKNQKIEPNSFRLISTKKYNKLIWHLFQKKLDSKNITDVYNKFIWVNGNTITKEELSKFNKIEDDEQKIKDLQEYNYNLQKKLERKEESINILDYKNKKLMEQIQNKTFANSGNNLLKFNIIKNDRSNSTNNNGSMGERGFESEKFKNILQQLNNSNIRETKLQNEVTQLKEKLKKKEEFEAGFPKHLKDIEPSGNDSGFLDDDIREQEKKVILDLVKSKSDEKMSTKYSGTNNNDNMEDNKKIKDENTALKNRLKEVENKFNNLEEMVKDLIKNVKYEPNIKPHIVQICQILGYSPQTTQKIVKNKISGLKNFVLK